MKTLTSLLVLFLSVSCSFAQVTNTSPWPPNPPVGIGTQLDGGPLNALHIHHDPLKETTWPAMLRLSEGDSTATSAFGLLGLMPAGTTTYSVLSTGRDLILHEHEGDLILTTAWEGKGTIRMSTTPYSSELPLPNPNVPLPNTDVERLTILPNGNVGIDLPPTGGPTPLVLPLDQVQIGGGIAPYPGNTFPTAGLTIYGGNRFENMMRADGGVLPGDWRYISFNHYQDHNDTSAWRSHRFQPEASSQISFSDGDGGMLNFSCAPFDVKMSLDSAMHDFSGGVSMAMSGNGGMFFWSDESKNGGGNYHHLLDLFRPGVTPWPLTRNTNGLLIHHTPVLITSDSTSTASIDFQNLPVHPNLGDGQTWMLAVNGPALFKEAFVSLDWPDYVFDQGYDLMPLSTVNDYIQQHHHLPGVPSADSLAKTGVPLGSMEAKLMEKIEELTTYAIEQDKRIERLEAKLEALSNQKGEKQ